MSKLPKYVEQMIADAQRELFGWVPHEQYQQMFPKENRERIRNRLRRGAWQIGVHVTRPSEKELWVHLRNVQAWVEGRSPEDAAGGGSEVE